MLKMVFSADTGAFISSIKYRHSAILSALLVLNLFKLNSITSVVCELSHNCEELVWGVITPILNGNLFVSMFSLVLLATGIGLR
jgi:hypothetical protein